jgi:multidrug efflux pump subunit AcrB
MAATPGLTNINFNWTDSGRHVEVRVRQKDAERLGLTSAQIAQALYSTYSGVTVTQTREGIHLVDVVMCADERGRQDVGALATLDIPVAWGGTVPLSAVADVAYTQQHPLLWRRNRIPTVTVQADVDAEHVPEMISMALRQQIDAIRAELPARSAIEEGGVIEESAKAQAATFATMPLMIVLMLIVLMIQVQSFRTLFLVLAVAPLGLIGVVLALLASGQYLGYVALLGIVSLIGMIVRNAVILVHQVDIEIGKGACRWDALAAAARIRARPIMLTAVAAILGMVPIAPTLFWGPMAYSIMGGLSIATLLTLFSQPAAYVLVYRVKPGQ